MRFQSGGNNQWAQGIKQTPFIVRFICILANWILGGWVSQHFPLTSSSILSGRIYELIRIFISWMYQPSLLTLAIMLQNMHSFLSKFENRNSSAVLYTDFFINLLGLSVIMLGIIVGFGLIFGFQLNYIFSIASIWMNMLYKYCYYNPEMQLKLVCTQYKYSLKYYPFYMFVLICLVNLSVRFDALLGLLIAIVECQYFNGGIILFVKETYQEKQVLFKNLGIGNFECWRTLDPNNIVLNHRLTVSSSQFYIDLANFQNKLQLPSEQIQQNGSSLNYFQGGSVRIGDQISNQ